ncbi:MAG: AAA family ATPase, partial [Minisyncoccia bacterium]
KKKNIIEGESNQLQEKLKSMVYEKTSDDYQKLQDEQQKLINLKNEYLEKITILRGQLIIEQEKSRVSAKKLDLNPEKILNNLDEIQKCLSKIQSLSELETIKKEILKISDKIENLIKYLRGEKKEEMTKPDLSKIEQEINNLGEEIKKLNEKIQLASQELAEFAAKEQEKRKSLYDLQKKIQIKQTEFNNFLNELNNLKIERARVETKKENLEEEIKREGLASKDLTPQSGLTYPENLFSEIQKLKHQLELIGGIDPEITKEYPECRERWEFLTYQIKDLKSALQSLYKIIKQLDEKIESQFADYFQKINEKFDYYFKIFFGGGKAKLVLQKTITDYESSPNIQIENFNQKEANQLSPENEKITQESKTEIAEIEIMANPPGKKLKNIEALSGGEKALTSLALICAIIAINKPPFVVLDEVDAALDEKNSARFANIIKDLSNKTQFIVITHNRQTMEAADILYGVTMGEDGVSKLLSMKF